MKYPKVRPLGHRDADGILSTGTVVLLEKVDGANFRWRYDPDADAILFGSRRQLFKEYGEPAPLDRVNKAFRHAAEHVIDTVDMAALADLHADEGGLWFFGESLHKHTIDYDAWTDRVPGADDDVPNYLGFDVYSEGRGEFLPHDEVEAIHDRLGLETVPVVARGDADEFDAADIEVPASAFREPDPDAEAEFDREGLAEGVVIKNVSLDLRAKVVAEEFAETHAKWSRSTPEELSEARETAGAFVNTYVTDARVQKQAHKLVDEGRYDGLEMPMMQDLPRRTAEDVFAEHGWEVLNDDELELTAEAKEEIRSQLSRRCSRVLQQMLQAQG